MNDVRHRIPAIRDIGLKQHIDNGWEAGKWVHDYAKFEEMRHVLGMTVAQIQRAFGHKTWSTTKEWFKIDDEEHSRAG